MNFQKYRKMYHQVPLKNRTWPDKEITAAPLWCSVDLRDGNQSLVTPMNLEEKLSFFTFLVDLGFKEIEVGFPAASETEFQFARRLIEDQLIPDDVTIQVLTQSRPHIIEKTIESIKGAKNAIIHLYNSTSTLQRRVVFDFSKQEVIDLAVAGAKQIKELCDNITDTHIRYEYSPESFTGTELEFAAEVCNAVLDVWQPTADRKAIINLPSTVELSTPNIYADQIEYMNSALNYRENIYISVHAHNDRGCGVAASELAILAGADRVEGTLFGNGERTGNADILVLALNMFSQGIDPKLNLDNIEEVMTAYTTYCKMTIHERHPYAGDLVYVAFSGSHQDAIKKGIDIYEKENPKHWENPYLPIDPSDLGRKYEAVRINSQSGKGGVNFILERKFGLSLPKGLLQELSYLVTAKSVEKDSELSPTDIYQLFADNYLNLQTYYKLDDYKLAINQDKTTIDADIMVNGVNQNVTGEGNGPLNALCHAMQRDCNINVEIIDYSQHALEHSSSSKAVAYIAIKLDDQVKWGAGIDTNINTASIKALFSALNK